VDTKLRAVMAPHPVTIDVTSPLPDAARLMRDHDIGDVVVLDGRLLFGILTDRDITVRAVAQGAEVLGTMTAGDACTTGVVTLHPEDTIEEAVTVMRREALRRVPVVDEGEVVGIVSLGDLAIEEDPGSALSDISAAPPNG
jgi:CBS domain-containing protein